MYNGELKGYEAHTVELNTYEKANYQWVNDSTMTFTLSNKYHNSKTFTVTGYHSKIPEKEGRTTSFSWD